MVCSGEGAAFPDALVVLWGIAADDLVLLHLNSEMFVYKIDSAEDGEEGIPFATSRPADFPYPCKGSGGHQVGQRKRLITQRCGLGKDGYEHT